MAYRNGTYVAFHADGTSVPIDTDMKYYRLLQAWHEHEHIEFNLINSHDKTAAVRDSSKKETLKGRLRERLNNSKNMLLIIGDTTKLDRDWIPFEISYAVDTCNIPIIAAYPSYESILNPASHRSEWPAALAERIDNETAKVIHIPFKKEPIKDAISQFDHNNLPKSSLSYYSRETYEGWGIIQRQG
jgi:hypothetical protein